MTLWCARLVAVIPIMDGAIGLRCEAQNPHQILHLLGFVPAQQIDALSDVAIDAAEDEIFFESNCYVKVDTST